MHLEDHMLPCMHKAVFGVDCPGCGMQRSALLLLKGDFWGAFEMYPGIYPMMLLFSFLILNHFVRVKYSNTVIVLLSGITVGTILINYFIKLIF